MRAKYKMLYLFSLLLFPQIHGIIFFPLKSRLSNSPKVMQIIANRANSKATW